MFAFAHTLLDDLFGGSSFLETLGITESVESVVGRTLARRHTGDHDDATHVFVADERVSQHHRQLVLAEGNVFALGLHRPNALFQGQQGLVDLSALLSPVFVVGLCVLSSLRTSQIHQQQFSAGHTAAALVLEDLHSTDSVRPAGGVVAGRRMRCSN